MQRSIAYFFGLVLLGLLARPAGAVVSIEITQGLATGQPIAVTPFAGDEPAGIAAIIGADLERSGRFQVLPRKDYPAVSPSPDAVDFGEWRALRIEAVVTGRVVARGGKLQVEMRLWDVFKQQQLAKAEYVADRAMTRAIAHRLADVIYEKLTGEAGAFSTRIAYITKLGQGRSTTYKLHVADADAFNEQTIVTSREPLMSPAWSPDGRRLAYVSFEERRSIIYVQSLIDGRRQKIAESRGINSAPAFSPDGRRLALVLSRDGNPEIYLYNFGDGAFVRATNNPAIDTEPAWSPNGRELVFTSDRSGRPQLYRMTLGSDRAERVSFEGDYNARASFAPDGTRLVLVTGSRGAYHAAILHLTDGALQVLTDTALDESPSFAPNGRMVLYATRLGGRGVLATVSADGQVRHSLRSSEGDIREPAWSPFTHSTKSKGALQ